MLRFARILSVLFRPAYYPVVVLILLLFTTYLSLLPFLFKMWLVAVFYAFTIVMPWLGVLLYRKLCKISSNELRQRQNRYVPYALHIISYICCYSIVSRLHLPTFVSALLVASLLIQVLCVVINLRWKVSMHAAGAGAAVGAIVAYSFILSFNPLLLLSGAILLNGMVMSSRMILRQHSLAEVLGGSLVGMVCGFIGIIMC